MGLSLLNGLSKGPQLYIIQEKPPNRKLFLRRQGPRQRRGPCFTLGCFFLLPLRQAVGLGIVPEAAREVAAETLADVKRAMKIDYFDDKELIAEQARQYQQQR